MRSFRGLTGGLRLFVTRVDTNISKLKVPVASRHPTEFPSISLPFSPPLPSLPPPKRSPGADTRLLGINLSQSLKVFIPFVVDNEQTLKLVPRFASKPAAVQSGMSLLPFTGVGPPATPPRPTYTH